MSDGDLQDIQQEMERLQHQGFDQYQERMSSYDKFDVDLYEQMEFPYSFQFALFFTFYTPLVIRLLRLSLQYVKYKVKGPI